MIGMLEATAGLGMMFGPLLGESLFKIGGYNFTFYSYGSLFLVIVAIFPFVLPKSLDLYTDNEEKSPDGPQESVVETTTSSVTTLSMFKDLNYSFCAVAGFMAYLQFDYLGPILAIRLVEFDLSQSEIGVFMSLLSFVYVFSSLIMPHLPSKVDRKVWILIGLLASFPT